MPQSLSVAPDKGAWEIMALEQNQSQTDGLLPNQAPVRHAHACIHHNL